MRLPRGDGWSADEVAFRLGLPGGIETKYNYWKRDKSEPPDLKLSEDQRYSKYIANCSLLSVTQKFWIKKVLAYRIDEERQFRGVRQLLCEFSGKHLVFQSKHIELYNFQFSEHVAAGKVDFGLWPQIEAEARELLNILKGAKDKCENLGAAKKPTERLISEAITKLTNSVSALEFKHPDDLCKVNLEIAALTMNPVVQKEQDPDNCVTQ